MHAKNALLGMVLGLSGTLGAAADTTPIDESKDYVWIDIQGEMLHALRAKGDPKRGEVVFEVCQGCHRAGALGRIDGSLR